jgi:hypothetical protein
LRRRKVFLGPCGSSAFRRLRRERSRAASCDAIICRLQPPANRSSPFVRRLTHHAGATTTTKMSRASSCPMAAGSQTTGRSSGGTLPADEHPRRPDTPDAKWHDAGADVVT